MRPNQPTARPTSLTTALVVLAMLCAQWVGLAHSIAHSGSKQESPYFSLYVSAPDTGGDKFSAHSCVLFEAAAIAASLATPTVNLTLPLSVHALALWLAFASWDAPFLCHFSPRAPPAV
ncbi:hypothetical protein EDC30_102336 [Paucimonas lemoignei]|uniref:Uncharacterized protein n=1 Tax=Paucimonas lemoignei TaxID=29443 RepID=A0A4R3HYY2_PAULE|nr:hypothetical protein [Paucimonas lemoignei]TCS38597.1 hypothetical protein EDC30_102336 [Paucimonas lemoignei]